jgi:hypothetical protein
VVTPTRWPSEERRRSSSRGIVQAVVAHRAVGQFFVAAEQQGVCDPGNGGANQRCDPERPQLSRRTVAVEERDTGRPRRPRKPIPTEIPSDGLAANTAAPQPPSTNQNVPMNSAVSRCSTVGSRMSTPPLDVTLAARLSRLAAVTGPSCPNRSWTETFETVA